MAFSEDEANLAATQVISRAVYPASELKTTWCPPDRTGRDKGKLCRMRAYRV